MTRPVTRRAAPVTADKPETHAEVFAEDADNAASPPAARGPAPAPAGAESPPRLSWGWRVFLFFWITSFLCLFLADSLDAVFRFVRRLLGP
jgi:hypothetical protein